LTNFKNGDRGEGPPFVCAKKRVRHPDFERTCAGEGRKKQRNNHSEKMDSGWGPGGARRGKERVGAKGVVYSAHITEWFRGLEGRW